MARKQNETEQGVLLLLKGIIAIMTLPFVGIKLMESQSWFSRILGFLLFACGVWIWLVLLLG